MKPLKCVAAMTAGLLLNAIPAAVLAQANSYSLETRSSYLSGCLLSGFIELQNSDEVVRKMTRCLCSLDRLQDTYTEAQFQKLSQGALEGNLEQQTELMDFAWESVEACIHLIERN